MINQAIQIQIEAFSKARYRLIDEQNADWEARQDSIDVVLDDKQSELDKKIDDFGEKIRDLIFKHNAELPFEFVIEELTKLGEAPCILYDDNGHFAITGDGMQTVCSGDEPMDCDLQFSVEAECWKDTMREALEHYLNS